MLASVMGGKQRFGIAGSEALLLAILRSENSACRHILNEYGINERYLEDELDQLTVLRNVTFPTEARRNLPRSSKRGRPRHE